MSTLRQLDTSTLNAEQAAMAAIIDDVAASEGIPDPVIAAMIVNAMAESSLRPYAEGDRGASIGLFQLHERGHGHGMSKAARRDPRTNTQAIITAMRRTRGTGKGADPGYAVEPPLRAYNRGVSDLGHLTAMFMTTVERPRYSRAEDRRRRRIAATLFPSLVHPGSLEPPRLGSALVRAHPGSHDETPVDSGAGSSSDEGGFFSDASSAVQEAMAWMFGPFTGPEDAVWTAAADGLALIDKAGVRHNEGRVPPGTYRLAVGPAVVSGDLKLKAGMHYRAWIADHQAHWRAIPWESA